MFCFQVKIPKNLHEDGVLSDYINTLCMAIKSCEYFITLDPGPDQCAKCASSANKLKRPIRSCDTVTPVSLKRDRVSSPAVLQVAPNNTAADEPDNLLTSLKSSTMDIDGKIILFLNFKHDLIIIVSK